MGHLDGAVRHFEAAMRLNARMGAACYLANNRYQYARVLRAGGASGHHELADDHMGRAIASATALGIELQLRRPDASSEAAQPEPLHGADLAVWTSGGAAGSTPSLQEGEELLDLHEAEGARLAAVRRYGAGGRPVVRVAPSLVRFPASTQWPLDQGNFPVCPGSGADGSGRGSIPAAPAGQRQVVIGMLGYEHRIRRQYREPVVHPFGVGGVLPVRKEPCGVVEGQPAFNLVDLERKGDSLRGACLEGC